ncbi:MAG: DNA recombination protein RmuC [Muribaculaceae bacterium]|nr:DNA recombination protein RmuC [Muribaculaceae bacterium]
MITVIAIIASLAAIVLLILLMKTREEIARRENETISHLAAQREESTLREASLRQEASLREADLKELASRREAELTGENARLAAEISSLRTAAEALREQIRGKEKQLEENREQNATLLRQQEERFKNLANEIMESNSRRFNETSSQRLNDLLSPLKENIENFRKVVGDAYNNESRERFSLQKELRELLELNKTIGREARDLTRALRSDSKMQGDWGEMILEKLLEKSGLQKGVHFDTQVTRDTDGSRLTDPEGKSLRADVVIYYPDDRCLVIDSKVSLTSFIDYINLADDAEDIGGERRKQAAAHHLASVKAHINELSRKSYQDLIGKKRMDFVMMFIPNEAAYIAAMQIEPGLWQEAYDKRVLMVSPTQLISVLRMLRQLWKQDAVNRNVEEIARLSGRLLDKFTGMMDAFDDVERHISNTQKAYTTLRSRLSDGPGNVFVTARKILDLGAKSTKQLPEK